MAWIRLDAGLLDDSDFGGLSAAARGAYITAYLLQKRRDGVPFKDHAELCRLLRKEGITDADVLVAEMRGVLFSPDPDGPDLGIKHYGQYQADTGSAERQKRYRDKMRASRNDTQRNETEKEEKETNSAPPRARDALRNVTGPTKMRDAMDAAGLNPAILQGKKAKRQVEGAE